MVRHLLNSIGTGRSLPLGHLLTVGILILLVLWPRPVSGTTVTVSVGEGGFNFSPSSVTIHPGDTVQWTWAASGHSSTAGTPGSPSGFWDSGVLNQGATFSHTFNGVGSFPYYCTPHGGCCGMIGLITVEGAATPTPTPSAAVIQALNISTRMQVQTGSNVLIAGFIITGTTSDSVVLRGIGPSLTSAGVSGAMADPTLELHDSNGALLIANDDWQSDPAQAQQIMTAGLAPSNPKESGVAAMLQPSSYTAILVGKDQTTGVGLVELYDISHSATAQLANISTRGLVLTGSDVMIAGFILNGNGNTNIVVRGIGPSLTGISGTLPDPTLELRDSNGTLLVSNDNWQEDATSASHLTSLGLAPGNMLESGLYTSLGPGAFTAILAGKAGSTGVGLVEVYNVH